MCLAKFFVNLDIVPLLLNLDAVLIIFLHHLLKIFFVFSLISFSTNFLICLRISFIAPLILTYQDIRINIEISV